MHACTHASMHAITSISKWLVSRQKKKEWKFDCLLMFFLRTNDCSKSNSLRSSSYSLLFFMLLYIYYSCCCDTHIYTLHISLLCMISVNIFVTVWQTSNNTKETLRRVTLIIEEKKRNTMKKN